MQLSISTSTAACSVALLDGNRIVAEEHQVVGRGHAEHLVSMIRALPGNGRADMIWVDCGPGSFTGTRVGIAAARALAIAWAAPVLGFSAMSLIAVNGAASGSNMAIALLAGHGELFVQDFTADPLAPIAPVQSLSPEAAASFIKSPIVSGSGAEVLVQLRGFGTAQDLLPRAADVRSLPNALRQLPARAIYVRAPDARAA